MNSEELIIPWPQALLARTLGVIHFFFSLHCFCTSVLVTDIPRKRLTRSDWVRAPLCLHRVGEATRGVTPYQVQNRSLEVGSCSVGAQPGAGGSTEH